MANTMASLGLEAGKIKLETGWEPAQAKVTKRTLGWEVKVIQWILGWSTQKVKVNLGWGQGKTAGLVPATTMVMMRTHLARELGLEPGK